MRGNVKEQHIAMRKNNMGAAMIIVGGGCGHRGTIAIFVMPHLSTLMAPSTAMALLSMSQTVQFVPQCGLIWNPDLYILFQQQVELYPHC